MSVPYFHTWCGLSANLRCRSETCSTWLAENTGRKKVTKNRHLGTIAQFCGAISSQLRHVLTIGKKISAGFASWQHYCTASSSGRQPNFAALNRGRHVCSAGRLSRWAFAHILVLNKGLGHLWDLFPPAASAVLPLPSVSQKLHISSHPSSLSSTVLKVFWCTLTHG